MSTAASITLNLPEESGLENPNYSLPEKKRKDVSMTKRQLNKEKREQKDRAYTSRIQIIVYGSKELVYETNNSVENHSVLL